jgi:hypothetical protein
MSEECVADLDNKLTYLRSRKRTISESIATLQADVVDIEQDINVIISKKQKIQRDHDGQRCDQRFAEFKTTNDPRIYEESFLEFSQYYLSLRDQPNPGFYGHDAPTPRYKIKRGTKWDSFFRHGSSISSFKVEKFTGNVYHTGKHPKCNIIQDPVWKCNQSM